MNIVAFNLNDDECDFLEKSLHYNDEVTYVNQVLTFDTLEYTLANDLVILSRRSAFDVELVHLLAELGSRYLVLSASHTRVSRAFVLKNGTFPVKEIEFNNQKSDCQIEFAGLLNAIRPSISQSHTTFNNEY